LLHDYTQYSKPLNSQLWKKAIHGTNPDNNIQNIHQRLIEAIASCKKIPDSFVVYSGVKNRQNTMPHHLSQFGEVTMPSYISTSTSPRIATGFSENDINGNKHILRIKIPRNFQHGAFIGNISEHPYEKEFLISSHRNLLILPNPKIIDSSNGKLHIWDAEIN